MKQVICNKAKMLGDLGVEDIPYLNARGERARLFPVLSEKSKEGRTLSAFLAVLAQVRDFSNEVLSQLGQPVGIRGKVEAYTEICFPKSSNSKLRPDGLIVLSTGKKTWTALVEAKIGNDELRSEQVEAYLALAREVGADCVITISNQFTSTHEDCPVEVNGRLLKSVDLFHLSWFSILTSLNILSEGELVDDDDHTFLLDEFERFLIHDSAGLRRFTQMGKSWTAVLDRVRSGMALQKTNSDVVEVVTDWQSEVRDLCLYLTRKTGESVRPKVAKKIMNDPYALYEMHLDELVKERKLKVALSIPDAAATLDIEADISTRTIHFSSEFAAPKDKKRQFSRVNWLVWQIPDYESSETKIRSEWPGRAASIESTVAEASGEESPHVHADRSLMPHKFVLIRQVADGRKFVGRSTFITELEQGALHFYEEVLSHIKAWVPSAPKIRPAVEEETG